MSQNEYEERKPIIYLAGIGMGQDDQLTGEVLDCSKDIPLSFGRSITTAVAPAFFAACIFSLKPPVSPPSFVTI